MTTEKPHETLFDNGTRLVGATIVRRNDDGSVDLHAAEADSNAVKEFAGVRADSGGVYQQAGA